MFRLIKQEGSARRGEFTTPHGTFQTPAFMNVATCGAIKGAVSALDLKNLKCQVQLCNTYHLHLRPGDDKIFKMGGLHKFTRWDGPILTDSGGFQVFSLAKLRNIKEEGVWIDQFSLDTPQESSFHNVFDYRQGDTISYDWLQFCLQRNLIKIRVEANTHPCQRKATIGLQLGNSHGTIKIIQECSKEKGQ